MITQTLALFKDAYHELNAKKLFWIVLILSGLIAVCMAAIGNDEQGMTVLWWEIPVAPLSTAVIPRATFYKLMFITLGFQLWLTWAATILALISTAGIIPDFVGGGAIELTLSKPIGRIRLFLTKYLTGLLFVALQVAVFSVLAFVVIGIRADAWLPQIFVAIPLVVLFFSYLYCVTALVGLVTRSTIPALLTTILIWLAIFLVHMTETGIVLQFKVTKDHEIAVRQEKIREYEEDIVKLKAIIAAAEARARGEPAEGEGDEGAPAEGAAPPDEDEARALRNAVDRLQRREAAIDRHRRNLERDLKQQNTLHNVHELFFAVKTVLPKTSETMELLSRYLIKSTELDDLIEETTPRNSMGDPEDADVRIGDTVVQKEMDRIIRSRSLGWIIGTSLLFEGILLGAACWIFCRRDF